MPMKCEARHYPIGDNVYICAMMTLICTMTTLLIAVGALILAVAGRAALDPEVVGYGMRRPPCQQQ